MKNVHWPRNSHPHHHSPSHPVLVRKTKSKKWERRRGKYGYFILHLPEGNRLRVKVPRATYDFFAAMPDPAEGVRQAIRDHLDRLAPRP